MLSRSSLSASLIPTIVAILVTSASIALAGEYHNSADLVCDECHALGHGDGAPSGVAHLKFGASDAVCLSCHDGKPGIPDVKGDDINAGHGARQAGALSTGARPYEEWKGHTLGATQSPGGRLPAGETALHCVGCHAPHGNANYRNLISDVPITYTTSLLPTNAFDVRIALGRVPPIGRRVAEGFYDSDKTFFNQATPLGSPYGAFCARCHGDFHGVAHTGGMSPFRRHPTDVPFRAAYAARFNAPGNHVQVAMPNNAAGVPAGLTATPSCMSCHKAHGSRNPFGLIYMKRTGIVTEQGVEGGRVEDLCAQCHGEGVATADRLQTAS